MKSTEQLSGFANSWDATDPVIYDMTTHNDTTSKL